MKLSDVKPQIDAHYKDTEPKHQPQTKNGRNLEKWKRKQIRRKLIILSNKIGIIPPKPPKPNE
jgi:hypothetical protein